jgi:signal transduction histidine kinase
MARADGDRRDIERRLHDGVQQDLVALAVNLQLAEEAASSDPDALKALLLQMRRDVREAIEGVRVLARDVYPSLLAAVGLAHALRGAASGLGMPVRIDATADRYPTDIEATVYFCCLDALETISGVGPSGRATIRVWGEDETLRFEVTFEGIPATNDLSVPGPVRTGMDDRMGAVGGTLTVAEDSEGTRVRGTIPLGGRTSR